jgi:hypothetical protein
MACLKSFVECVELHRLFQTPLHSPSKELASHVFSRMHDLAAIEWCKVFGSASQQTHWRKALPADCHETVKQRLSELCPGGWAEWLRYRKSIVEQRDQLAAHHDLDAQVQSYPHFDLAIAAARLVHDRMADELDGVEAGGVVTQLDAFRTARQRQFQVGIDHLLSGRASKDET